ncbi:hypothetical protein Y032_0044g976 [Ancylostoma ceylanicum]|uniref:Uncharacterized protein n=1 Tax=Ancylostoma ceylanicum TaxID=53326 RepID=A0A016UDK6_9BILA|nr:hypothetical protein Y032_0044g976 [Ancylostoma ceylanicum]
MRLSGARRHFRKIFDEPRRSAYDNAYYVGGAALLSRRAVNAGGKLFWNDCMCCRGHRVPNVCGCRQRTRRHAAAVQHCRGAAEWRRLID